MSTGANDMKARAQRPWNALATRAPRAVAEFGNPKPSGPRGAQVVGHLAAAILGILAVLLMASPAGAQGHGKYELKTLGTWGGQVNAVQVEGDLAYVAAGRRLVILNISDLTNPVELGSIDLGTWVQALAVRAGYAFVGADYFRVVDVSDPSAPELIWSDNNAFRRSISEVDLYANVAYAKNSNRDIKTFDIADPRNPAYHGEPAVVDSGDTTIVDDLMYVVADYVYPHLRIYDLSTDPFNPVEVGIARLPGDERTGVAIAVEGDYAYALTTCCDSWDGAFAVVDVSNPYEPVVLGSSSDLYNARDVAVLNGFAYVADWESGASPYGWERIGLKIFDIATDPSNPTLVNTYKTHGTVSGVEVYGTAAYVFDEGEGLITLDVSDATNPVRLGNYYSPAELRKMAKVGDLLYVSDEWNGMTILDVSDGASPTLVGVYQTPQDGYHMAHWGLEVRDAVAYLAAGYGQLQAVDVTDPANPVLLGVGEFMHEYGTYCFGLGLWGHVASLGFRVPGDESRFVNFDISDPQNIAYVGDVEASAALAIDTSPEGIAFCASAANAGWLTNVDTSDPTDPFIIYSDSPGGLDLVRNGNLVYMANGAGGENIGGLYIHDVTDPANPVQLGYWQPPTSGSKALKSVALSGEFAYVTRPPARTLYMLDVSDPTAPSLVTELHVPGAAFVLTDDPYVYVTGYESGLTVFELCSTPDPFGNPGALDPVSIRPLRP